MRQLSLTLPTLPENLALDEALLLEAEDSHGGETLRFWHWPAWAVVLGAGGVLADDVEVDACRRDGVPIARRSTGGGTVLIGPGCLMFALILRMDNLPELQQIGSSYRFILGRIAEGLCDWRLRSNSPAPVILLLRAGSFPAIRNSANATSCFIMERSCTEWI